MEQDSFEQYYPKLSAMGRTADTQTTEYALSLLNDPRIPVRSLYRHFMFIKIEHYNGLLDMHQVYNHINFIRGRFHELHSDDEDWNERQFEVGQVDPALLVAQEASRRNEKLYIPWIAWNGSYITDRQFQVLKSYCDAQDIPLIVHTGRTLRCEPINPDWIVKMVSGRLPGCTNDKGDCVFLCKDNQEHESWETFTTIWTWSIKQREPLKRFRCCRQFASNKWAQIIYEFGLPEQVQWYGKRTNWKRPTAEPSFPDRAYSFAWTVDRSIEWESTETWKQKLQGLTARDIDENGLLSTLIASARFFPYWPLHYPEKTIERVHWFLQLGADPNRVHGQTSPLCEAICAWPHEQIEIIKLLIPYGADINQSVQVEHYSHKTKLTRMRTRFPLDFCRPHWHGHWKHCAREEMANFLLDRGAISRHKMDSPEMEAMRLKNREQLKNQE